MSEGNALVMDSILKQIEKLPKNFEGNWNGIPSDRISIYRDIY